MSTHWIPRGGAAFLAMCNAWGEILSNEAKVAAYKWVVALVEVLLDKLSVFVDADAAFTADNNDHNRRARKQAQQEAEKAMREFAASSIRNNPFMSQADRADMGLPVLDATHTVHPAPTEVPELVVEPTAFHFQHRLRADCAGMHKGAKPEGVHGVNFAWQVGGERPSSGKGMPESRFSRRTTIVVEHEATDRGKTVYYSARYENAKGEAGKWCAVEEWIIG